MTWNFSTAASLLIFLLTYVLICLHRIPWLNLDRPTAALLGAVLMIVLGLVPLGEALRTSVSWETLALLFGMMVIVAYLKLAGFFEYVATAVLLRARTPRRLLALLVATSGLLSAFFVNDTICVLFTPLVLGATRRAKLNPVPFLVALVTSANLGSSMTLTGNPQNMLVGIYSGIGFGRFFFLLFPVAVTGLVLDWAILGLLYRRELEGSFDVGGLELPEVDRAVIGRVLGILALVTAGFLLPAERLIPGLEPGQKLPLFALGGAVLAFLLGRYPPARAFSLVDWGLLIFFSGLFVVTAGIGRTGVLGWFHAWVAPRFGPSGGLLCLFSVALSNLVSNVPYVLLARAFVEGDYAWCLVSMASTLAGNLTIVGSVANMIVLELSRDQAKIGFWEYLKAGFPVTVATTTAGFFILYGFHRAGMV
jgi:Na+/H+ antiporter NhaD/arsenite permease-like protein